MEHPRRSLVPRATAGRARAGLAAAILLAFAVQAELVVAVIDPVIGLVAHAVLLVSLLVGATLLPPGPLRAAVPAVSLLPVLRILSLTMPIPALPPYAWYALVGVPLLAGIVLAVRAAGLRPRALGLRRASSSAIAWRVALAGVPLGVIGGAVGSSTVEVANSNELILALLFVFLFAGVVEELLFRGLLQRVLRPLYGRWSLVVANLLFTAAYLPTQSLPVILLMAGAGLLFGWSVERTGALWPAMAGHGLLAVTATVIWPALLG